MSKPMTNYNERLNEIFYQHSRKVAESAVDDWEKHEALTEFTKVDMTNHYTEAKQAITSLIKELVAEAKPEIPVATSWQQGLEKKAFEDAMRVYEYNLLKALESK